LKTGNCCLCFCKPPPLPNLTKTHLQKLALLVPTSEPRTPNTGTAATNSTRIIYLVAIEKKQRCVYLEEGKMNNDPSSPSSCPFSAPPKELAPGLPVPGFQNAISRTTPHPHAQPPAFQNTHSTLPKL